MYHENTQRTSVRTNRVAVGVKPSTSWIQIWMVITSGKVMRSGKQASTFWENQPPYPHIGWQNCPPYCATSYQTNKITDNIDCHTADPVGCKMCSLVAVYGSLFSYKYGDCAFIWQDGKLLPGVNVAHDTASRLQSPSTAQQQLQESIPQREKCQRVEVT